MQAATKVSQSEANGASGAPVAVLSFTGDISSASKDAILDAYHAIDAAIGNVLLDFGKVDYINSSGIAIIIQMLLEVNKTGGRAIGIFGLSPHFSKVFTMVGVARYATLSPDRETALSKL